MQPLEEWLGATTAVDPIVTLETDPNAAWPLSGIQGYSVTTDGSVPDGTVDVLAAQDNERWRASYSLDDLDEGITELRIRGISNSGVASPDSGIAVVRLDRHSPTISADGMPEAGTWRRERVDVGFIAQDQTELSGMVAAPPNEPVENGAYLAVGLDGYTPDKVRGGQSQMSIDSDGHHVLVVTAFDRAGNASAEYSWKINIDQTAPTGAFDPPNPSDPRQLHVSVSDALSGVAGGDIEYRRVGEGAFTRLPTSFAGRRLGARLDDLALPRGRYEFRAVVRDVAGNRAVIGTRADGAAMTLELPVRAASKVQVSATSSKKRCVTIRRKRRGEFRRSRKCRTVRGGTSVTYGTRLQSTGSVRRLDGTAVANAAVTVQGQPRSGGAFVVLGRTKTDANGNFRFTVPAGPSQTLRYGYAGTDTDLPSSAALATKVTAAARLKVDRRRLRNGQAVRFSGRLLGRPVPRAGKLVALQAKVGRRWRTFATPRANARGVFRHRYRFTATTGRRRYAFRAVVTREAAYPFERGSSKVVRVTVRGR